MSPALALPSHLGSARRYLRIGAPGEVARRTIATCSPLTSSISITRSPRRRTLRTRIQPRQRWCEQQLLSRPGMPARAGPMLAARGTVYRHAIICGTVARITIATRPPRAAPTRHVTIRGCAPGTTGAGSQVPRVLSAKTRACGRASVPG